MKPIQYTPYRHIRLDGGEFKPTEYESHELVKDKYDAQVNRGLKSKYPEKRYGRKRPDKFYCESKTDYRGFRALTDDEVREIQIQDAQERAQQALNARKL